jgi:hypothetical protein
VFLIDKEPRIFVYTIKNIKAGELIYINYGNEYNVEGFICPSESE